MARSTGLPELAQHVLWLANVHKGPWSATLLYEEPLLFVPRSAVWPVGHRPRPVQLKDIADESYLMVPDACGLSRATRALFRSQRRKLHEYSGEANSYQVLEEWAALGIGAAILPSSKPVATGQASVSITGKAGHDITIAFEAAWSRAGSQAPHLLDFAGDLRKVVPCVVGGLRAGSKHK